MLKSFDDVLWEYMCTARESMDCKRACMTTEFCPRCGIDHLSQTKEEFPCDECRAQRVITRLCPNFKGRA